MKTETQNPWLLPGEHLARRATRVARYYGFAAAEDIAATGDEARVRELRADGGELRAAFGAPASAALSAYLSRAERAPALFYHLSASGGTLSFGLEAVGIPKSLAETLLLKTAIAILEECGTTDVYVRVNSIGDRDSQGKFLRELGGYLRKHLAELPARGQELLRRDAFAAFVYVRERCREIALGAPRPMEFLSEQSRRHLREVLEHLEAVRVPYEVDSEFLPTAGAYSQTVFEIRPREGEGEPKDERARTRIGAGGRYDEALRRACGTPASGVHLVLYAKVGAKGVVVPEGRAKAKVYFIQLGTEAQLRALAILELLRKAHVPLRQSFGTETLAGQLLTAERLALPYAIIMGQKEALERTVIVRHLLSRRQETISVDVLPHYLKHLKL